MVENAIQAMMKKVGFYTNRLRKERITKIVAGSAASLALILQLTVGVLPFTSTPVGAVGDDNIIRGGISSKAELLAMYDSSSDNAGHNDIKKIYTHFGVARQDIANATMGSYKTNDFNGQIKSVGRTNWPNSGRSAVKIDFATTVYTGPFLDNANSKAFTMPALIGKRSVDGQWFAVTLNCGNIVYTVTPPPAVTPPITPKPVSAVCKELSVTRVNRTKVKFDTDYTVGTDKVKSITYVVSDETGTAISRSSSATYTQVTTGTYDVKAIVNVADAKGQVKSITSTACAASFTVLPAATPSSTSPKMCTVVGKENLTASSSDCKEVTPTAMCTVVGKENLPKSSPDCVVVVVPVTPTPMCTVVGKEHLPASSPDCVEAVVPVTPVALCTIAGKENLPSNSPDCVVTVVPVTPPAMCTVAGKENLPSNSPDCVVTPVVVTPAQELPKTGLGENILKVTGAGSLIAAIGYYAASRRGLLSAFLNQ